MRKHGTANFSFEVIEECVDELINEREQYWVAFYDSFNPEKGYNMTTGGLQNTCVSEETKQKLSEALKGNTHCVGRVASDETRDKLRKCGPITVERRFGAREKITEDRTCRCGNTFTVTCSSNRKAHVRKTCSEKCAQARERPAETRNKISTALQFEPPEALLQAIKANTPLVQLMDSYDVSYSTLKRLRQKVKSE